MCELRMQASSTHRVSKLTEEVESLKVALGDKERLFDLMCR